MKLSARDTAQFLARPDPGCSGVLIFGQDATRVASARETLINAVIGPGGSADMRLTRMSGADVVRDPAAVTDAMRAQGFFPGPRAVLVDDATDGCAGALALALEDWAPGDATLVVTSGPLKPASRLRKLFEADRRARAAAIFDTPPGRAEIARLLRDAGITDVSGDADAALQSLAQQIGPGDFRQTLEKIALYKLGDATPLSATEVVDCAPRSHEAGPDEAVNAAFDGVPAQIGPVLDRLQAQGVQPVALCIACQRHLRALLAISSDPEGPGSGIARLRPPVFGPRRDRMLKQARQWGSARLEHGLTLLVDTDLALRSGSTAPTMALMERALIRLAMLGQR